MNANLFRNIIDKIEQLSATSSDVDVITESRGLAGRRPGEEFANQAGDRIVFTDLKFFPEGGGKFEPQQLDAAIKEVEKQLAPAKIQWENSRSPRSGGFGLATFTQGNKTLVSGRYFDTVKANPIENYMPNTVFGSYKLSSKAAQKIQSGLTPQELLTKRNNLTVADIMNQLAAKLGTSNPLYHVANHVATGGSLPYEFAPPADVSFTAFRDYFCEILQPIALHTGVYTGNAGTAASLFLKPEGFEGTRINFDDSKNAGLADSTLTLPDGRLIKVSSKGGKGAAASVGNLTDSIEELGKTQQGKRILAKYSEVIEMLSELRKAGQAGAPLYLGEKYGIITPEEAEIISAQRGQPTVDIRDVKQLKARGLTPNLIKLAQGRATDTPEKTSLFYHLLAAVAHIAAEYVNTKTDFSKAASTILNNGALIQVYTQAKESKDRWTLVGFDTVYPGSTVTGVQFNASKTYYSTDIKGNYTFKILRAK